MNYKQILKLQKEYGFDKNQEMINSGDVWQLNGSEGRYAMHLLEVGVCMLPKHRRINYYGQQIPSRDDLKKGTEGTFQNCSNFWSDETNIENFFGL
jgi:hypothetical protein